MCPTYQQSIEGMKSTDSKILLDSALWIVTNPEQVNDQHYLRACEILCNASSCDPEGLQYIHKNLKHAPGLQTQLLSQVIRETKEPEIKQSALVLINQMIDNFQEIKKTSTELIAQIYSSLEELGDAALLEKAKKMM